MGVAFPAHAGMNRQRQSPCIADSGVPRACGDEPRDLRLNADGDLRSPRMRG